MAAPATTPQSSINDLRVSLESLFSIVNPFNNSSAVTNSTETPLPTISESISSIVTFLSPALATCPTWLLYTSLAIISIFLLIHFTIFTPPSNLRHLPRVSPYPIIWSYIILKYLTHNPALFPKKNYQEHLHFSFLSGPNVVFSNGEQWKRHSESVKAAFDREIPVYRFVSLAGDVMNMIGGSKEKGVVKIFSDLVQKYTLDVVGTTLLGHNFEALKTSSDDEELSFVDHFNQVMTSIATPVRLIFPFLDTYFPRTAVIAEVDALNARYDAVLEKKKGELGLDLLSYLLEDDRLSHEELRSNLSILFSAGHDTTSGAIASCVYFLSRHPEYQQRARQEVLDVLQDRKEPAYDDHPKFKFLYACIKEAMRINPPISLLPARWTTEAVVLSNGRGGTEYPIPQGISLVPNVWVVHNNPKVWKEPAVFDPYRFMPGEEKRGKVRPVHHIPFGTGPRQCVARQFSLYEQRTLLAMLLIEYEWRVPTDSEHREWVKNEFGAFGLSIPHHLDIEFVKL
ncbi:cytochrome P450 4F5 [Coprinopsis cinerea okayama7|uniref:Cytochrome P450 4F5 n=1 Tax=Coprinopsis cinerea (strain Okayama-7 / 130 / ATCC MYA-4618 / FGSC 9003) TaxID=240176 RepID=A8NBN0_COPC7|nr:cytochrome P450 4F5 [Coprinopsis cinerea okayama7\|eukprot:XP_001832228.2 cytochrome P450 4F5 [Coprinopsis cinerea okayama7\